MLPLSETTDGVPLLAGAIPSTVSCTWLLPLGEAVGPKAD